MKYDLLKKEFGYFGSFMVWDNTYHSNGLPEEISDKKYRDENLNKDYIYLAMNIRLDKKHFGTVKEGYLTNKDIFDDDLPDFFIFHGLKGGKYNVTPYTRLNKLYTGTILEGSYITDFFKVSPKSDTPDGYCTASEKEVFSYIYSLNESKKKAFLCKQLKALDREIFLLEIDHPKIIVMDVIKDLVSFCFEKYVNKNDFPNLYKAEIVDSPSSFGTVLKRREINIIYEIMVNIDPNDYPIDIIKSMEKNIEYLMSLKNIDNKAHLLSIFYLSLDLTYNFSKDCMNYLKYIKEKYRLEIEKISQIFSKKIIIEIVKNFFFLYVDETNKSPLHNKVYLDNLNNANANYLIRVSRGVNYLLYLLKTVNISKSSFIVYDIDSYVFINLYKKILNLDGFIFFKNDDLIKDMNFEFFATNVEYDNFLNIKNMISVNNIDKCLILMDFSLISNPAFFGSRVSLLKNINISHLYNHHNKEIAIISSKDSKNISYKYYNDSFTLVSDRRIEKDVLMEDNLIDIFDQLNEINKSFKLIDLLTDIKRGNKANDLAYNDYNSSSHLSLKYISNGNINKGFLDDKNCIIYKVDKDDIEKSITIASKGDILLTKSLPYYAVIVDKNHDYLVSDNIYVLKVDKTKVDSYYVLAYLLACSTKNKINTLSNSSIISMKTIKNIPISIYSDDISMEISKHMKDTINNLKDAYNKIIQLNTQKEKIYKKL